MLFGGSNNQNLSIPGAATTLSVTGASGLTFGSTAFGIAAGQTGGSVSIIGAGALVVNNAAANFIVGPGSSVSSSTYFEQGVYMGGLASFSFNGANFYVGANGGGGTFRSNGGTLQLATSSSITTSAAGVLDIGDNMSATNAGHGSALYLSTGTNTINTNTLDVGHNKQNGTLAFTSTAATTPMVTIRGASGGTSRVTTFDIGDHTTNSSNSTRGTVDFSKGQVNAMISTLTIGAAESDNNVTNNNTGTCVMGPNPNSLVDATTINMALITTPTTAPIVSGTLTVEGGTLAFGSIAGPSANQTATITFSGGSTICDNGNGNGTEGSAAGRLQSTWAPSAATRPSPLVRLQEPTPAR